MAKMRIQLDIQHDTKPSDVDTNPGQLVIGSYRGSEVYLSILGEDREIVIDLEALGNAVQCLFNFRVEDE